MKNCVDFVNMKIIIAILFLMAVASLTEAQRRSVSITDDEGQIHLIDLQRDIKNIELNISNVALYLYTSQNRNGELITIDNLDALLNSQYFDPSQRNVFIVHGWISSYQTNLNPQIRNAIFDTGENINAFSVDWSIPANQFYTLAVLSIPFVGELIGNYINQMISEFNLDANNFSLIGHSLGAHVAGSIGSHVNGEIGQIVGLDPAGPMFNLEDTDNRLDVTDGKTVHIAHTNGGFQGIIGSIGHADFFFNGGVKQAGCGPDITNSCAHFRAVDYYVESILTSGFRSVQCPTYEEYQNGDCNDNEETYFGGYLVDDTILGDYYLDTAESSPYALG